MKNFDVVIKPMNSLYYRLIFHPFNITLIYVSRQTKCLLSHNMSTNGKMHIVILFLCTYWVSEIFLSMIASFYCININFHSVKNIISLKYCRIYLKKFKKIGSSFYLNELYTVLNVLNKINTSFF